MARRKTPTQRKLRTREHVLADLSVNHVERQVFRCDWSVERVIRDYGIDLVLFTYNGAGEADEGHVLVQVKAAERTRRIAGGRSIAFRVSRSDLRRWLAEPMPLILVVYDAAADAAWWLYVQNYFRSRPSFDLFNAGQTVTLHVPVAQGLTPAAVRQFGQFRDNVLAHLPEDVHS